MTALLCPVFQEPQFTSNNEFLAGGLLWFYEAGSSSPAVAYTTNTGDVPWSNPIVLDSRGETGGTIWLDPALSYRIVLESKPYYGQTHGVVITEHDDITGVPVAVYAEEWVPFVGAPTYISSSRFTVPGDQRSIFTNYRKLRLYDNAGETIHSVTSCLFGASVTTVDITGSIDVGLSRVDYSFVSPDASPDTFDTVSISQNLTVDGNATIDGNVTIGGNLGSAALSTYWRSGNCPSGGTTSNGYQELAGGVIMQWGVHTLSSGGSAITLPTPFTTADYAVTANAISITAKYVVLESGTLTASGFTLTAYAAGGTDTFADVYWLAIGK